MEGVQKMWVETLFNIIVGSVLLILSWDDIKSKTITIIKLGMFIPILVMQVFIGFTCSWIQIVGGILLGIGIIFLSYITQGKIGLADGVCITFLGAILGFIKVFMLVIVALFLVAGISIFLLALKKAKLKTELPFLPFLFLGYIGVLLC